jgi:hypothetical protein
MADSLGIVKCRTSSVKYYKNMTFFSLGWQTCFVVGYERNGEPYNFKILKLKRKF